MDDDVRYPLTNWQGVGVTKPTKWTCTQCGAENKSLRATCSKCLHEPYLGSAHEAFDRRRRRLGSNEGSDE
jgi:predicted ATP-dependent serine protease